MDQDTGIKIDIIGGTEHDLKEISFQIQYIFPVDTTAQEISKAIAETL